MAEANQYDSRLRSEELRSQLNYHNRRYYELDSPEVPAANWLRLDTAGLAPFIPVSVIDNVTAYLPWAYGNLMVQAGAGRQSTEAQAESSPTPELG